MEDISILEIPVSQLMEIPGDLDLSYSSNDLSFSELPQLSSALKVVNFIINQCPDN